jgi:hypothetical protein
MDFNSIRGLPVVVGVASILLVLALGANDVVLGPIHHSAHLVLPLVAFVVFSVFVARDIRDHGWPTFSWRL